jgi:hypothetical protein
MKVKVLDETVSALMSFPQGTPQLLEEMNVAVMEKGNGKKRKRILNGELNGLVFRGYNFGDDTSVKNVFKYAIGVVDESSKKVSLIPVDHPYSMTPNFERKTSVPRLTNNLTYSERKSSLTESFGSRKKQRALKAMQSNIISTENISGVTAIEKSISKTDGSIKEADEIINATELALVQHRLQLLPPFNLDATKVDDVYPMKSLIPLALYQSLENIYDSILENSDDTSSLEFWLARFDSENVSKLITHTLEDIFIRLPDPKKSKFSKKLKAEIIKLLYLKYLLNFYLLVSQSPYNTVARNDVYQPGTPAEVARFISETYSKFKKSNGKPTFHCTKQDM